MLRLLSSLHGLFRQREGNIAITAAAALPLLAGSAGLAVDYAKLTLEKREAQTIADLAAIGAAANIDDPAAAIRAYLADNDLDYVLKGPNGYSDVAGRTVSPLPGSAVIAFERGRYSPDPAISIAERFEPDTASPNAVRVQLKKTGELHFASLFADPPEISVTGTAYAPAMASFSIGSRLASLKGGIANQLLDQLLGTQINLKAMDYEALLDTDISLLSFLDALATEVDLTAASYEELLSTTVSISDFTAALAATDGASGAESVLLDLASATSRSDAEISLAAFLDAGPLADAAIGTRPGFDVAASALSILSAAATVANGGSQIDLDLGVGVPGLASVEVDIVIGEPPQGSSWIAIGEKGATVRTAQTRLRLNVTIGGHGAISLVNLPLYLEVAYGEARLADLDCDSGSVTVAARPGLLEAAIGHVGDRDFEDFNREPVVRRAKLVNLLLTSIEASAHLESSNIRMTDVVFSRSEIDRGEIKTVRTKNILESLTRSLIERLEVRLLGLDLLGGGLLQKLLAEIIGGVASPLDSLINELLMTLGVGIGEADIKVTGLECGRSVLVQ